MSVAWEGGHLPVFFGNPPPGKNVALESEMSIQVPITESGKRALRRFMAEVASNFRLALTRLVDDLEAAPKRAKRTVSGKLKVFRFKAGTQQAIHPPLIL
jgi:hypothetical protein